MEQSRRFGPIELATWDVRAAADLRQPARDAVSVHMPLWGQYGATLAGCTVQVDGLRPLIVSPGIPAVHHLNPSASQRVLRIDESALTSSLARLIGRKPDERILFSPSFDLTEPSAVRWTIAVGLLVAEADTPNSLLDKPGGVTSLVDLLLSSLLLLADSNYSIVLSSPSPRGQTLRRALDHIDANLAGTLRLGETADAALVSPRTLQELFRVRLGESFSSYVRGRRLEKIRTDLQSGVSVSAAGARWGLPHGGRLAVWYRDRFGESPGETAR